MSKFADIVIVGGGLVGSTLACKLSQSSWLSSRKILLLESGAKKAPKAGNLSPDFSNRVVALNPGTKRLFKSIGAWNLIQRKNSFDTMFIWDQCSSSSIEFKSLDPIAYIIENDLVIDALDRLVEDSANKNLKVIHDAKVQACHLSSIQDDLAKIELSNGEVIEAALVIGADGANSFVRKAMGVQYMSKDYKQMGLVGTVTFEPSETRNNIAFQKFLPSGPIALLPLTPGKASLVWTLPTDLAKKYAKGNPEDLAKDLDLHLHAKHSRNSAIDGLNTALGLLLRPFRSKSSITSMPPPKIIKVDNPACFPLGFGHAERYVANRVALVGDAAHRIHPLAGQGVNLGYGDVEKLVRALEDNVRQGQKFASYDHLCEYETECMRLNLPLMGAVDGLQQLYCSDNQAFVAARSLGLQFVNANPNIKNMIMSAAS